MNMKRITKLLLFALLLTIVSTTNVKAEGEGLTVYYYNSLGWDNVYVYSWSENSNAPEMTEMEAQEKKNWYAFTFDESMGDNIEFLFYNGEWGETNQTQNLKIEDGKSMYYYSKKNLVENSNSKAAETMGFAKKADMVADYKEYKAEKATEEDNTKEAKIYFRNDKNWSKVYVWAWNAADGSNIFSGKFPGEEMEKYNDEWYVYTVKCADAFKCLFNNGINVVVEQTGDSSEIRPGGTYWVRTAGDNEVEGVDGMGGGYQIVVHDAPQVGWPEGKQLTAEEIESSKEAAKLANKTTTKNNNSSIFIFIIGIAVIIVIGVVVNNNHKKNNRVA